MRKFTLLALIFISTFSYAQIPGFWQSKEFSKDVSLFKAKTFLTHGMRIKRII